MKVKRGKPNEMIKKLHKKQKHRFLPDYSGHVQMGTKTQFLQKKGHNFNFADKLSVQQEGPVSSSLLGCPKPRFLPLRPLTLARGLTFYSAAGFDFQTSSHECIEFLTREERPRSNSCQHN